MGGSTLIVLYGNTLAFSTTIVVKGYGMELD